jgi:hypothetical protein
VVAYLKLPPDGRVTMKLLANQQMQITAGHSRTKAISPSGIRRDMGTNTAKARTEHRIGEIMTWNPDGGYTV